MRLEPILESLHLLGSLWGGRPAAQVCPAIPLPRPELTLGAAWASAPRDRGEVTAFVDVNVVPMDQERVLPHQTVLVEGGRITALGSTSQVKIPVGAVRVDGRGQYLMPGLADVHVHSAEDVYGFTSSGQIAEDHHAGDRFRLVTQGITSIRVLAEGGYGPSVEQLRAIRQHFRTSKLPTPRPFVAAAWPVITPPESLAAYVAAAKAGGYDHLGLFLSVPWGQEGTPHDAEVYVDSLVAAARRVGLPISEHTHTLSYKQILAMGSTGGSVEHNSTVIRALGYDVWLPEMKKAGPREIPLSKVREIGVVMRRTGVWLNPSLDCQHSSITGKFITNLPQITKTLHEAGVKFLLAADESTVQRELTAMVRLAGLSPYEALLTGTRNVAEYFHRLEDLGTVAAGKRADLVLLPGNPLADIKYIWDPAGVMVDGRWVDQATLDQSRGQGRDPSWNAIAMQINAIGADSRAISSQSYPFTQEQAPKVQAHLEKIQTLDKSLKAANPSEYIGVLQQLAAELGALRARLTPEQQMMFDPLVRLGVRVEARKGHQVTIPGVAPVS